MQFDNEKAMLRHATPKGNAGLQMSRANAPRRVPLPPASTTATFPLDDARFQLADVEQGVDVSLSVTQRI